MKSWKTSTFGLMAAVGGGIVGAYATGMVSPGEFPPWIKSAALLMSIVGGAGLGFFARDNNITSEQAGLTSTPPKPPVSPFLALLLVPLLLGTGCRSLDKTGFYQGDQVLYSSELTITTAYDVIETYVTWEYENRAALANWPELRQSADAMRRGAPEWFKTAHAMRDAYAAAPTDPNRAALETALRVLRETLNQAAFYMTRTAAQPSPRP